MRENARTSELNPRPRLVMLQRLKKSWRELEELEPGKRFQERYRRSHREGGSGLRKLVFLGGGTLVILAGLFFLPAPGPGFLILFIGGGLLAQESLAAARVLDWSELRVRRAAAWGLRLWKGSSAPVRVLLVCTAGLIALGAGYAAYQWMFAR